MTPGGPGIVPAAPADEPSLSSAPTAVQRKHHHTSFYNIQVIFLSAVAALQLLLCGCVSVPTAKDFVKVGLQQGDKELIAKQCPRPPSGWAGLYLYRPGFWVGSAVNYEWEVDGCHAGKTSNETFLYRLVKPGEHKVQWHSWNIDSTVLTINPKEGENVFLRSVFIDGFFSVSGTIVQTSFEEAKSAISSLGLALDDDFGTRVPPFDQKGSISASGFSRSLGNKPFPESRRRIDPKSLPEIKSPTIQTNDTMEAALMHVEGESYSKENSSEMNVEKLKRFYSKGLISAEEYKMLNERLQGNAQ